MSGLAIRPHLLCREYVFLELADQADLHRQVMAVDVAYSKQWKWQPRYRRLPNQVWHGAATGHLSCIRVRRRVSCKRPPLSLG